jgi:hypothetical protein
MGRDDGAAHHEAPSGKQQNPLENGLPFHMRSHGGLGRASEFSVRGLRREYCSIPAGAHWSLKTVQDTACPRISPRRAWAAVNSSGSNYGWREGSIKIMAGTSKPAPMRPCSAKSASNRHKQIGLKTLIWLPHRKAPGATPAGGWAATGSGGRPALVSDDHATNSG